jgi:hypothetical protein
MESDKKISALNIVIFLNVAPASPLHRGERFSNFTPASPGSI